MQLPCIEFLLLQLVVLASASATDERDGYDARDSNGEVAGRGFLAKGHRPSDPPNPCQFWANTGNCMLEYDDDDMEIAPSASRAMFDWKRSASPPEPRLLHELVFRVKQKNLDELKQMAEDRTKPSSPNYGQWLSRAEIQNMTRNIEGLQVLKKTLLASGSDVTILQETGGGEFVRAVAPVSAWAKLLRTEFHVYEKNSTTATAVRADKYNLPKFLRKYVAGILGAVDLHDEGFFSAKSGEAEPESDASLVDLKPGLTTPAKLREAYNVPPVAQEGSEEWKQRKNTSQSVFASLNQHWSPSDRKTFQTGLGLPLNTVDQLDMGTSVSNNTFCKEDPNSCAEANLDTQYMMAISPYSQMGLFDMPTNSTFTDFLVNFAALEDPPHVISISYGMPEIGATDSMVEAFEIEAMKFALQGITLIVSSGDDGAASTLARYKSWSWWGKSPSCARVEEFGLQTNWPASSAWVTSVGATMGVAASRTPEITCQVNASKPYWGATSPLITSGGGYSKMVPTPDWQASVNSRKGRGVPDVSLDGHAYAIVVGGRWMAVDGTSASAPSFAGMVSLMNARRKAAGLTTLGFLNPLLYANEDAFNDITIGDNRCASAGWLCCGGYDATVGWDPVTGLGTPDFRKLEQAIAA